MADYFVQMRRDGDYKPNPTKMEHVQETLQLLSVLTGDHRYEEACENGTEGGPKNMCEVLDRIENKGRAEGENIIITLMQKLFAAGRSSDAEKASNDAAYRLQLLKEFGLV